MRLLALAAILFLAGSRLAADRTSKSASPRLRRTHKGKVAVAVKNLKTGEEFYLNADERDADREPHQVADHGRDVLAGERGEGEARQRR